MSFRPAEPADTTGWTTAEWAAWLDETAAITSIRADDAVVCARCRRPKRDDGWPRCYACNQIYSGTAAAVVPIAYAASGGLTSLIAQAKDEPDRWWVRVGLAALLFTFIRDHLPCLEAQAGGQFDVATVVPSHPSKRNGRDHMKDLIRSVTSKDGTWSGIPWELDLLTKTSPAAAAQHRQDIDANLFTATRDLKDERVLLVDDLYTSGSTTASACFGLTVARARKPVVVTLGRQLDVRNDPLVLPFVEAHKLNSRMFESDQCAVHLR